MPSSNTSDTRSIGELVSELVRETRTLVHQEIALAKWEFSMLVAKATRGAMLVVAGAAAAYAGALSLVAALVLALVWLGVAPAAAAFVVGATLAIGGLVAVRAGIGVLRQEPLVPEATMRSVRTDLEAVKGRAT